MNPVVYNYDYLCFNATLPASFGSISSYGTIISFESTESGTTPASAYDVALDRCTPWVRGGIPELTFSRIVGELSSLISSLKLDPWNGHYVSWWNYETTVTPPTQPTPNYLAATVYFTGTVVGYSDRYDHDFGWVRDYRALGLRNLADYVPVTDSNTLTDSAQFNMPANTIQSIPSRMGRTCGQAVIDILSMKQNATALQSYGIGNYTSTGSGASATATVNTTGFTLAQYGVVTTITVNPAGSGYTTAPQILVYGPCISQATATCTVTSGSVNGPITPSYGGTGYTTAPAVIISTLPTATTITDLENLTVISPFVLTFCGERLLQSVESIIQTCHPNHWLHVDPVGNIRVFDQRVTTNYQITLGYPGTLPGGSYGISDGTNGSRWMMPQLHRDLSDSYSQLIVRGDTDVSGIYLSVNPTTTTGTIVYNSALTGGSNVNTGGLYPYFTFGPYTSNASAISHWNPSNFVTQSLQGGQDQGSIASFTSSTQINLQSTDTTLNSTTLPANILDQESTGLHAILTVSQAFGSSVSQMFSTAVISNTAATAGAFQVTVAPSLPATTYTSYFLTFSSQAGNVVYRRYICTAPGVGAALQNYFPYPFAYRNYDGTAAALTSAATGMVLWSASGSSPYNESDFSITVDPESGTISFPRPTALVYGGGVVTPPSNIMAFVPIATGDLTLFNQVPGSGTAHVINGSTSVSFSASQSGLTNLYFFAVGDPTNGSYQIASGSGTSWTLGTVYNGTTNLTASWGTSGGYAGTIYTVEGISRSKTITLRDWTQYGTNANIQVFANEQFDSIKDVVVEGSINYLGLATTYLTPGASVSITGNSYITGFETLQTSPMPPGLPVSSVEVIFNWGAQGTSYITTLNLSNRRQRYTGAVFTRPPTTGQAFGGEFGAGYAGAWSESLAPGSAQEPPLIKPAVEAQEAPPAAPEVVNMPMHPEAGLGQGPPQ